MKRGSVIGRGNMEKKNIFNFPDLDSYLIVSDIIKKHGPITLGELVKKLEGKVKKSHVETIVDYMLTKNKIKVDENGKMIL